MKTIRNKTTGPLRVPLPQSKFLHLGPRQTGQINHQHVDHPPLKALVEKGDIEILGDGDAGHAGHGQQGPGPHASTHGYQPRENRNRGDR